MDFDGLVIRALRNMDSQARTLTDDFGKSERIARESVTHQSACRSQNHGAAAFLVIPAPPTLDLKVIAC